MASPVPQGPAPVLAHANNPKMQQPTQTRHRASAKQRWIVRLMCSNAECSRAGPKAIENNRGGSPASAGTIR